MLFDHHHHITFVSCWKATKRNSFFSPKQYIPCFYENKQIDKFYKDDLAASPVLWISKRKYSSFIPSVTSYM